MPPTVPSAKGNGQKELREIPEKKSSGSVAPPEDF